MFDKNRMKKFFDCSKNKRHSCTLIVCDLRCVVCAVCVLCCATRFHVRQFNLHALMMSTFEYKLHGLISLRVSSIHPSVRPSVHTVSSFSHSTAQSTLLLNLLFLFADDCMCAANIHSNYFTISPFEQCALRFVCVVRRN